jgi:hypothetical protein
MKRGVETGLRLAEAGLARLTGTGSLDEALARFDWFYCGAEFCENLLPSPAWHEEQAAFFLAKGARVCLLTPPVSEKGLKLLKPVFRRLAAFARKRPGAEGALELTVNDLGALELAREECPGLKLNAGRLLHENMFLLNRASLSVLNARGVRLFAGLGVGRFEISTSGRLQRADLAALGEAGAAGKAFAVTLHYPYMNLTSARTCVTGLPDIPPELSAAGVNCRRECGVCAFEVSHPRVRQKLYVKGNTLFLKFPDKFYGSARSLLSRRIDRLVYSPFL